MSFLTVLPCIEADVRVRPLKYEDATAFAEGTRDEAVRRFGHLPLSEYTPEVVREQIDGVIAAGLADGSLAVLAVADAQSDGFLGSIVLFDVREDRAEVGFWLAPWARGRGAAQQALRATARMAAHIGLSLLVARTAPENEGSRRVLEGAGFRQVGPPRTETVPSGEVVTVLSFERPLAEFRSDL